MTRFYYRIKPLIPRSVQLALRRLMVAAIRRRKRAVWPIDPSAASPPEGWRGWPERKRFALCLSHDVDTASGASKVRDLAEAEMRLGFRSSFNFVPERYTTPTELRQYLKDNGFEVAVHGLVHDGKLFWSRKIFDERARRINHYLEEWDAVGFHSPSMHRNLEWIHDLNIEYDQSTFDTDPFEPQPDGVGTIFPYAVYKNSQQHRSFRARPVSRPGVPASRFPSSCNPTNPTNPTNPINPTNSTNSTNSIDSRPFDSIDPTNPSDFYIELPYTLPQDHTLFVIMREKDISIWKEKLDWVAEKGGMALLNSHPDYMNFRNKQNGLEEYPASYYLDFLTYVKTKYRGQYWHALPRDIARFWRSTMAP